MSQFVEFLEQDYVAAGDVFAKFDGRLSKFTLENALALMWFAQLAYEVDESGQNRNAQKIETVRTLWGFTSLTPFAKRVVMFGKAMHTTGLIGVRADAIVLAFAGTDLAIWETVATDARFDLGARNTHTGFQAAFEAVAPIDPQSGKISGPVGDAMALRTDARPQFVTGHSLGAAIAILAAEAAHAEGVKVQAVYGFGTPCPGGGTFQQRYNAALGSVTYRLVHGRDVVARVPTFAGYTHVGCLLEIDQDTKFPDDRVPESSNDPRFFAPKYLAEIGKYLLGGAFLAIVKGPFVSLPKTPEGLAQAIVARMPSREGIPLPKWFKLLPPFFREHLQDRYLAALTPGAARIRSDL